MWTGEFESSEYQGEGLWGELMGEGGELPMNEAMEMELAAELLGVTNEAELEQFLGGLFKKVGGFFKSGVGKSLGGILKGIAKKALPIVGGAIGSFVAPGVGTAAGSALGSMAGKLFGLELEGLSGEDREFEVARRFVRLASTAAQHAAQAPADLAPLLAAKKAVVVAARQHAPGLYSYLVKAQQPGVAIPAMTQPAGPMTASPSIPFGIGIGPEVSTGRWIRRGNAIILLGA